MKALIHHLQQQIKEIEMHQQHTRVLQNPYTYLEMYIDEQEFDEELKEKGAFNKLAQLLRIYCE